MPSLRQIHFAMTVLLLGVSIPAMSQAPAGAPGESLPAAAAPGSGSDTPGTPREGLSDIERLVAIEEIKRLKARRDHALDLKDWKTYEALHTPDIHSHADGLKPWTSAAQMTTEVSKRLAGITTAHHSHTPVITFESPVKARGVWSMEDKLYWKQGDENHWYHGFGFYHETYEKRDGTWLIASRRLVRRYADTSPGAKLSNFNLPPAAQDK